MTGMVYDGGKTGMNALLFGLPNLVNNNDIQVVNEYVNPNSIINTTDYFNQSINTLNTIYSSNEVINLGKQLIMNHGSLLNHNVMMMLDRTNITSANLMMQHVIMSHPDVIRLDKLGVINGFSNVSIDTDLVSLMNSGNVKHTDDYMEYNTYSSSAYDEYTDDDKSAIVRCWEVVNDLLAEGLDPTSEELDSF